jgi:hypothetical protein
MWRRKRMTVDERARHRLYRKLEQVLGSEEAGVLMAHLPPAGYGDLATKEDLRVGLEGVKYELRADMERLTRRLIMWTSSVILAAVGLAFAAGRFV